jgi:hypothetical protein
MIAREHSAAGSAIFLLFTVVLFCYEEPRLEKKAMVQCLGVKQKKCVRVVLIAKILSLVHEST